MAADLFDPQNFVDQRKPLLEASLLPAFCYTSEEWYRREVENVFMKQWLLMGRADLLPNEGDYFVEDIVGESVLFVHGKDGRVRAFSPVCRHRGSKIVEGKGNCKVFVCPYHGWTYGLDGSLRRTPDWDQVKDFDPSAYGLAEIRLEEWKGFLFINFDGDAVGLLEYLGDLPRILEKYRLEDLRMARQKTYEIGCNWKYYVENSQEVYHLPMVHGTTIENVGPKNTWRFEEENGAYMQLYGVFAGSLCLLEGDKGFPAIEGMSLDKEERHELPWVFPNTHFLGTVDNFWWLTMFPEGPENMRVVVNNAFHPDRFERPDFEKIAANFYKRLDTTNVEDNLISERQQKGAHFRFHRPGRLCHHERNVHLFANYIIDRVVGPA